MIRILQQIRHLYRFWKKFKFFSKNLSIFSKKAPNFERFEKSYYFSRILRQICYNLVKKFSPSERWTNIVNAIGKHRVKKRQKWTIWEEDFAFIFLRIWRKTIKLLICLMRISTSTIIHHNTQNYWFHSAFTQNSPIWIA